MVLHTYSVEKKYLIANIRSKFPKYLENQFANIAIDRLEYLENLVKEEDSNSETEIKRLLKIK